MKKLLLFVAILFISFSGISYAVSKFNYESALQIANEYITNSSFDENWKSHNPKILEKGKDYFTDSDSSVSYVEFKVSCDNNPDCGFVLVNFDGDDVIIPIASTSGNTPSEVLIAQNGGSKDDNKLYYFSPLEQYAINEKNEKVSSIDPIDNIDKELEQDTKLTEEQKEEKRIEHRNELKNRIIKAIKDAGDYKKTDDFKSKLNELREQEQSIPEDEVSYKILPFAEYVNADNPPGNGTGYVAPTASNIFVSGNSYTGCDGKLPCYTQFYTKYNGNTCYVGCSPVAYGLIYGYYDRNGTFPNLLTGVAPTLNSTSNTGTIENIMIRSIGTNLLTTCSGSGGLTSSSNITYGIQYAKDKGYTNSTATKSTGTVSFLFNIIKSEINNGRPIITNTSGHSMVAFGYNSTSGNPIIRLNMGWGPSTYITGANGTQYKYSNIDYNMNSIFYNGQTSSATSTVKVIISN